MSRTGLPPDVEPSETEVLRDMFLAHHNTKPIGEPRTIKHGRIRGCIFGGMDPDEREVRSQYVNGPLIMTIRELVCAGTEIILGQRIEITHKEHGFSAPKKIIDPADLREALKSISATKNQNNNPTYQETLKLIQRWSKGI